MPGEGLFPGDGLNYDFDYADFIQAFPEFPVTLAVIPCVVIHQQIQGFSLLFPGFNYE